MADGWAQFGVQQYDATGAPVQGLQGPQRPEVATIEGHAVGGVMTAVLPAAISGGAYLVRRITVSVPAPTTYNGRAFVYVGQAAPENLVMGTNSGALDVALEDPPLFIPEATPCTVQWDAGATRALARFEYMEA